MERLKSHSTYMQQRVASWMQAIGVRALNTYGEGLQQADKWTCGLNRKHGSRSMLDYIGVSIQIEGIARPTSEQDLRTECSLA
eukprot:12417481-Karenia_brevis.AAC.1